jgi:hypothetical protein
MCLRLPMQLGVYSPGLVETLQQTRQRLLRCPGDELSVDDHDGPTDEARFLHHELQQFIIAEGIQIKAKLLHGGTSGGKSVSGRGSAQQRPQAILRERLRKEIAFRD